MNLICIRSGQSAVPNTITMSSLCDRPGTNGNREILAEDAVTSLTPFPPSYGFRLSGRRVKSKNVVNDPAAPVHCVRRSEFLCDPHAQWDPHLFSGPGGVGFRRRDLRGITMWFEIYTHWCTYVYIDDYYRCRRRPIRHGNAASFVHTRSVRLVAVPLKIFKKNLETISDYRFVFV